MSRGTETKIPIQIRPNKQSIDSDYIFEVIFYRIRETRDDKNSIADYRNKAKKIFEKICQSGGLNDAEWKSICAQENLSQGEWQFITKKLKLAGLIRKDGHIYRPGRAFLRHLQDLAVAVQRYYFDLGVKTNEDASA